MVRKEIHLSNTTVKMLQHLADKEGRKLKPYMERVLVMHAFEKEAFKKLPIKK